MKELSRRNIACCNFRELIVNFLTKAEVASISNRLSTSDIQSILSHISEEYESAATDQLLAAIQVYIDEISREI